MKFNVVATGSSGNMFIIDDKIAIDIGVPYKKIESFASELEYLLLTHKHCDHLNKVALRKLLVNNDRLKVIAMDYMIQEIPKEMLNRVYTVELDRVYKILDGEFIISPFEAYHDVPNIGYRFQNTLGEKHLHITDTNTVEHIIANDYDSASIECNHEPNYAKEKIKEAHGRGEFSHLVRAMNTHLAVDKAIHFIFKNNINKLYPIHIGNSTREYVLEYIKNSGVRYENCN